MADGVKVLFRRYATEMKRRGLIRPVDLADGPHDKIFAKIARNLQQLKTEPAECLLAAAAAGLLPTAQPPAHLSDNASRNRFLFRHLERRDYHLRPARAADLPTLMLLERHCWASPLRTSKAILKRRIARYPQGQLVLLVDDAVAGVIYSQCIEGVDALNGITAAEVDSLHRPDAKTVQLLAINILPEMQQRALGDQLLEFMLVYRSLQKQVDAVVAITRCKNFDLRSGLALGDYIRRRNEQGVLADPILRFHELHGASVIRVMPGYRPADLDNEGCGVLVSYDVRHRHRNVLQPDTAPEVAAANARLSRPDIRRDIQDAVRDCLDDERKSAFASDRPLMEMGLDSADLLLLNEKIAQCYRLPLVPTFFFQYDTVEKISDYLCDRLATDEAPRGASAAREQQARWQSLDKRDRHPTDQDVAIVGMACRLPGGINTPDQLWACLEAGRSVIGHLPTDRWQWPDGIDPEHKHRGIDRGGFLDDVAAFDAPFFRISPAEAESMDPQQRMLLELCWQAIEHAGYAPDALAGSRTGVFVGASGSDYARLLDQSRRPTEAHYGTGSAMAVLANRISYFYDFRGPSLLLDAACSSSLVAVHEAVRSIATGESEQALVGGINLILHPANSIAYYKSGMLSKDGLCRTFDRQANGYVRSEGAVVLLLKPLRAALADHDKIHAVIKGTACNHGGQASGLTVPNPERQSHLLQEAWQSANIDPRALGYIEVHGTGTPLGDPIEVQGIKQAFAGASAASCGLGSLKTNLGHLEAAAGIAGLLKTVLCLRHRQLPASLHFQQLNGHIDLATSGLHVIDRLQDWLSPPDAGLRLAGVSSFGSGGTNAHVVVEEYRADADPATARADEPVLFVLSAKTPQQLRAYSQSYADWLGCDSGRSIALADLAYQLQAGRQAMAERLALVIADRDDLICKLNAFCADPEPHARDDTAVSDQFRRLAEGEAGRTFIRALAADGDLEKIALLWQSGIDVDWSLLNQREGGRRPLRVAAPTYPFARHRYWLPTAQPQDHAGGQSAREEAPRRAADEPVATLFAPVWNLIADLPSAVSPDPSANVLVVGGSGQEQQAIRSVYPTAHAMEIDPAITIDSLSQQLRSFGDIDHIVWLAPQPDAGAVFGDALIERQPSGLMHVFKLVKALRTGLSDDRELGWTVVTRRTQAVFGRDVLDPTHAGVHGFLGALAKEVPRWSVRLLDLESERDWPVEDIMRLPMDRTGDVLARRSGQWFRQRLSPVSTLPDCLPSYRQNGVYVVIGGAGGIGEAWTRHVIEGYQAQVIWIGRSEAGAAIEAKCKAMATLGPAPVYIAADASDIGSLQAAYATIKQSWPVVHGVIHSAVGAFDRGIADTDEQQFRDIVSVKIDASVHLAEVFGAEPLDFLLYFSSIVALEKTGGLSGYAAGGAFEDAFALHLRQQGACPAKVINWGHWEIGTGAVVSEATKTRLQHSGIVPIRPEEAMAALDRLLSAPVGQLAFLKCSRLDALPLIDRSQSLHVYADVAPPSAAQVSAIAPQWAAPVETLKPLSIFNNAMLEAQLMPLFAATLNSLGLLDESKSDVLRGAPAFYRHWLAASRKLLAEHAPDQSVSGGIAKAWQDWEQAKRDLIHPDLGAAIDLIETCLRALPEILSGRTRATDIIFPGSSMRRVEGIYRDNAVADYFNQVLAQSLVAAVAARLEADPDARLRILEVGAGTGGSTAMILPLLAPYQRNIADYAYTDVSKAFLFHAEERFVRDYPFVRPLLFDIERPLAEQGVEAGCYDAVIGTNVLHATRAIRGTLSTCKAALRKGGLLLLNEISSPSLFAHLTFGLLEGWWLSEDQALRIPNSPGLYPENWQTVLQQEGFATVGFPASEAHELGQQVIVAESDGVVWQREAASLPSAKLASTQTVSTSAAADARRTIVRDADGGLKERTNSYLRTLVAKTLRMDSGDVDVREPLEAYGIDSILVVQITDALREAFPAVRSTLLFECQTIDALSDHFIRNNKDEVGRLVGASASVVARDSARPVPVEQVASGRQAVQQEPAVAHDVIAVIGMSCRFPLADGIEDYWHILASGQDCIREVPPDRWPLDTFFHDDVDEAIRQGKSYSKWGGFLDGVTEFDPLFFNILPKDATAIDPQERLFLQTAWAAIEDAGYTRERLTKDFQQKVGVFVGITRTGFDLFGPELWRRGETIHPHTSFSSVANRLSYFLNARGPSVPVDTMCSSSLTAIHQACQSLRSGECELAIAGGVNVYLHPSGYVGLSASRMLSRDGVCRSFGKGGNGFVPGEGVAAVLLKPLSRAVADNDVIYATIRATHVNHGGKTNGYTVPNPQAQAELVRDALHKAGVDARAVSYVEAHGTGTELGDPIEVTGLTQAFRQFTQDTGFCALGSAKSNVGHLEAAAGIAGFIKVVLQMRHGQLVPSLHAAELNPNIDFSETPFVVQRALADWQRPTLPQGGELKELPRIAGISSFGAGGANAHVIVEEYREADSTPSAVTPSARHDCMIVLSAKSEERLKAYAGKLHAFIVRRMADSAPPVLADLAYTLQVGREPMEHRLALIASSLDQARDKLKAYLDGGHDTADVHLGHTRQHRDLINAIAGDDAMQEAIAAWFARGAYSRLLTLWTKGLTLDWDGLHRTSNADGRLLRRISLPTYPFATTRYWLPIERAPDKREPVAESERARSVALQRDDSKPNAAPAKRKPVMLRDPASVVTAFAAPAAPKVHALTPLNTFASSGRAADVSPNVGAARLDVRDLGDGILAVGLDRPDGPAIAPAEACAALTACIEWVDRPARSKEGERAPPKVVLLSGLGRMFPGASPSADVRGAADVLAGCAVPLIAVMSGDNGRDAMTMAAACDMTICSAEGSYECRTPALSGRALRQHGFTVPVVASAAIEEYALDVARSIARASSSTLSALKRHLSLAARASMPTDRWDAGFAWPDQRAAVDRDGPQRVALKSEVVTVDRCGNGVAVLTLCDRSSKNTSSPAFVQGVTEAFEHVRNSPDYKVVVLTGYDHYFACGGTKEGLLAIQSGKARFTDEQSYAAPLACDIPVIAAMQGHAIGAGWAMGLCCDVAVYSEESVYQSPYMLYGFTPGAGSTLIFPQRLGSDLSWEILLTAREFQGRELKERGIGVPVLPRNQVLDYALALASHLALSSREELVQRKRRSSRPIRDRLQAAFAQELALHDQTFVGNKDVIANIARYFNEIAAQDKSVPPAARLPGGSSQQVIDILRQSLADELSVPREQIADDLAFTDIGVDSISAVTWIRKINKQLGLSLAATKIYSYPTLARFAEFVASQMEPRSPALQLAEQSDIAVPPAPAVVAQPVLIRSFPFDAGPSSRPEPTVRAADEADCSPHDAIPPIAIIGMAGQFPAAADVKQFWRNVAQGRECISEIPTTRWSIDAYHDPDKSAPGKTVCRRMGVLDDIDLFDPLFFNLSPSEAEYMDPQQRLFLENSWRCIEDAGYDPTKLGGVSCGVFVGCAASDYGQLMAGQPPSAHGLIGESVAMLPARIAYFLNLQGPCLAIDTACSASLVAIANACDSLVLGNCDVALAGGVYVINGPDIHVKMSNAGMLSPDGRCFSFDQRANGFVPGEGVGVVLLKRLDAAERDGDDIYAVIRGWGVNQDGKTNGITAPNQDAQARLEAGVYRKFGINPEHIQLIEAHGTGTKLGDPIEVEALRAAFGRFTERQSFCALGSVKSNIGHLATAAGVAGVIKSALALQHGQLPPTINYRTLNEHIDLEGSPFYVNTQCKPWPAEAGRKRMVAVSSFGFSGTNAHMVLEDYARRGVSSVASDGPILLPLSAKSREQLVRYAQAVSDDLADGCAAHARLADIAYTFQTGRPPMRHRLAVVARTVDELRTRLSDFASAGATGPYCCVGEADKTVAGVSSNTLDAPVDGTPTQDGLAEIAGRWVRGETIDWATLNRAEKAQRLHGLPSYPFARERYWVPQVEHTADDDNAADSSARDCSSEPAADDAPKSHGSAGGAAWCASELPTELDWEGRLRHWFGKQILVVHADHDACQAFRLFLAQLKQACGLDDSTDVAYCGADDVDAALTAKRADCVLLLGGGGRGRSADVAAMVRRVLDIRPHATVVIFVQADAPTAERLGDLVAQDVDPGRPDCLLVSQSDCADLHAAMQRLFKEWLAFGAPGETAALTEIHYDGDERLSRSSRDNQRADHIGLIRKDWRLTAIEPLEHHADRSTVLVLVNEESWQVARALLEPGDFKRVVFVGDANVPADQIDVSIDFDNARSATASSMALLDRYHDITHVIDLADLHDADGDGDGVQWGRVVLYQTLVGSCDDLSIICVTKGLQAFRSSRPNLAGAEIAGLVKMLSADYRHVDARTVDIDQAAYEAPSQLRRILLGEFESRLRETEICYRDGQRFASSLAVVGANDASGQGDVALEVAEDAVCVISGGTNGVGLELAKHLAGKGCRKLVLMGITPLPPKARWSHALNDDDLPPYVRRKLPDLIELDHAVDHLEIYTGSLTDQHLLRRYFMKVRATLGPIRGVIHAAAVYSDADTPGFANKDLGRMRQVWESKAAGLESLHAVFKTDPLDFFVCLSSLTGLVPYLARGASDYAMANSFIEFFTAYQNRQAGNHRYRTIAWSDWDETGAITRIGDDRAAAIKETFDRLGLRTFSNREGCVLFDCAMACNADRRVVIGYVERSCFERVRPQLLWARPDSHELACVTASSQAIAAPRTAVTDSIRQRIEQWQADKRSGIQISVDQMTRVISLDEIKRLDPSLIHEIHELLFGDLVPEEVPAPSNADYERVIASTVKEVLKLKSLDRGQPFQNFGLDSISATVLAARLEKKLKREMPPKWLIEFPTVEALSCHLMTQDGQLSQRAQ